MLNLYGVTVWHSSEPRHFEMIEIRTYSTRRAEHLARESVPCCRAIDELLTDDFEPRLGTALDVDET
jgi:hypothetical protein